MKNNNSKSFKERVIQIIDNLFEQNGQREIPDVAAVCSVAKTNRKTALKYMYEWWDKYHTQTHDTHLINCIPTVDTQWDVLVKGIAAQVQCLIKQLELHSNAINFLSDSKYPLANSIIHTLEDIQDKLFATLSATEKTSNENKELVDELKDKRAECSQLYHEIDEMQEIYSKKLFELQDELEATRREAAASKHLVKSLKRNKRVSNSKNLFYYQNYNT